MSLPRTLLPLLFGSLLSTAASCGGDRAQSPPMGSTPSVPIAHTRLGSFILPVEGGRLQLENRAGSPPDLQPLAIEVPPGAVRVPTVVTVSELPTEVAGGEREAGPALLIEPADLLLAQPLTIELPYRTSAVSADADLQPLLGGQRQLVSNPLRNRIVSQPPRPFRVSAQKLGTFQSLIVIPTGLTGFPHNDQVKYLDVVFVIDSGRGMAKKWVPLLTSFTDMAKKLTDCSGLSKIRVAFTTTDVGLSDPMGKPWEIDAGDRPCNTPNGDDGKFQGSCRDPGSKSHDATCDSVCPATLEEKPTTGDNFIEFDPSTMTSNLGGGALTPARLAQAFGCMGYRGIKGCGIGQPFEATHRALKNKGFFQYDPKKPNESLLLTVLVSDGDDCSIEKKEWSDPRQHTDGSGLTLPQWNQFGHKFRCFALANDCSGKWWNSAGKGLSCEAAKYGAGTYLQNFDYQDLKGTIPTGLGQEITDDQYDAMTGKYQASRNVLLGLIAPLDPYDLASLDSKMLYSGARSIDLEYGWGRTAGTQYLTIKESACGSSLPGATVAPQHRISQLAEFSGLRGSAQANLCVPDEYAKVFDILKTSLKSGVCH